MDIILDANILIADYWLTGTAFRVTLDGIHRTDRRLFVPEVVISEVVAKYREHLDEAHTQLRRATQVLERLVPRTRSEKVPEIEVDEEALRYATQLRKILAEKGVRVLPWPSVGHELVVGRILAGRRPTRNETGYRDALIWESILAHLAVERPAEAVFVSNNSKDFCENGRLHPHLVKDVATRGLESTIVSVELTLAGVNERVFEPMLAVLDKTKEQLQRRAYGAFDLHEWLEGNAGDLIDGDDLRGAVIDLPQG